MNKYDKKVNKTTKSGMESFVGTAFEGSYYWTRKELKKESKRLKKEGRETAF